MISWSDCSFSAFISEVDTKTYISIYLISLISYPFLPYDIILRKQLFYYRSDWLKLYQFTCTYPEFLWLLIFTSPSCHSRSAKHFWPDSWVKEIIFQVPFSSTCSLRKVSEGIASFYRSSQPTSYFSYIWPFLLKLYLQKYLPLDWAISP